MTPYTCISFAQMVSYGGQSPLTEEDVEIIKAFKQRVEPEHRPPIKVRGVPASYANAAYINASRDGTLDQLEADLGVCNHMFSCTAAMTVLLFAAWRECVRLLGT